MKERKQTTIGHGMKIVGISFMVVMSLMMAVMAFLMIRAALYPRYEAHAKDVITHLEDTMDVEDMKRCLETGVPSEKYNEFQQRINRMVDDFELLYINVSIPTRDDKGRGILINVVSSTSDVKRAAGKTDHPIGFYEENVYTEDTLAPFFRAWENPGQTSRFSSKPGSFGSSYVIAKPLLDADGNVFALLCARMSIDEMHNFVNAFTWRTVVLIALLCVMFSLVIATWLTRHVVRPLRALETSAHDFAEKSHGEKDPSQLVFDAPQIRTENEIQSLSNAITQMAEDMRDYVQGILSAEKRAETAEEEVEGITKIAYEDVLTHVKSKVAYDTKKAELAQTIADGGARFALVMIDINNLKRINDTYGLENGDKYIISSSEIISEVYKGTPVYRVGGDEFVVILEGDMYNERDELFNVLEEQFREAQTDMSRELWERCSAAAGMTDFSGDADSDVDQVYRRAEKIMLRNKRMMKNDLS